MDAVEYVKTLHRLCKSKECCSKCKLYNKKGDYCIGDTNEYAEKAVRIVKQWGKEHPVKTRQSEFLKLFPDAELCPDADFCRDVINILPCSIEKEMSKCCDNSKCEECRKEYWLSEVTDND